MATPKRPQIFLLCLSLQSFFDDQYSVFIDAISNSAQLQRAKTANGAIKYLESNTPKAIIVTDEGLTAPENAPVLAKIQSFLRDGGLVIFGLHFPNFTNMDVFDTFWQQSFGVAWKSGDYHRTTFQANPSCALPQGVTSSAFPPAFSMKVLHVKGAKNHEKIFVPVPGGQTQSMVFPPAYVDETQAAVVGAKVGSGFLVYVGDVNGEKGSDKTILALCGI